ncbi:MAG: hypothetical protein JW844_03045 [Candidatus Omnitrophica bacterium]|nr:hypothetical protein [Candidatus Omnitrophota bacterium]
MKTTTILLVVLCAIVVIVYWDSLDNEFAYDDIFFIVTNTYIQDLSQWGTYFTRAEATSFQDHGVYRPLRTLSYALDYRRWGLEPRGYHLVNLLLHIVSTFLVYRLCIRIFSYAFTGPAGRIRTLSLIATFLFALHPAQSETVNWLSCRGDLLFAAFYIGALLCYLRSLETRRFSVQAVCFLGATVLYICALLSKEPAITLPAALVLLEWLRGEPVWRWNRSRLKRYIPFVIISGVYLLTRLIVLGFLAQLPYWRRGSFDTFLTMIIVVMPNIRKMLFPARLHIFYKIDIPRTIFDVQVLMALGVIALVIAAVVFFRREKIAVFAFAWFVIHFLPTSNIGLFTEHFLYLPLLSFCLVAALGLGALYESRHREVSLLAMALLFGWYSFGISERTPHWRNDFTLWESELRQASRESYIAHTGYGIELGKRGRIAESIGHLERALELNPEHGIAHYNLAVSCAGETLPDMGRVKKHLVKAIQLGYPTDQRCLAFMEYLRQYEASHDRQ